MNPSTPFRTILVLLFLLSRGLAAAQSLGEVARKEEERRKALESQRIEGKVILEEDVRNSKGGNLTLSSPEYSRRTSDAQSSNDSGKRGSADSYTASLKKLDREIRQAEQRIKQLSSRLYNERWSIKKMGKQASSSLDDTLREKLEREIEELQAKIKLWREERRATYAAGRKAGFLPGELDGRD